MASGDDITDKNNELNTAAETILQISEDFDLGIKNDNREIISDIKNETKAGGEYDINPENQEIDSCKIDTCINDIFLDVDFDNMYDNKSTNIRHPKNASTILSSTPQSITTENQSITHSLKMIQDKKNKEKLGHRRVESDGQVTYKNIKSTKIMGLIQLGIKHAVRRLVSEPERDLLMNDFLTVETYSFNAQGSDASRAHRSTNFVFKTYAPIAFRYFRDLFGISNHDYLISFSHCSMTELPNSGSSGSIFYVTEDDRFIMKTVQNKECNFIQTLLPGYYMNLHQNPKTLLPKFFGLYCYRCESKNIRLLAMNNILPSSIPIHQKYDLKGSTYKRRRSKSSHKKSSENELHITFKDVDFLDHHPDGLYLDNDMYNLVTETIKRDCRVLESFQIMDYSLLLGITNLDIDETKDKNENISSSGKVVRLDENTTISPKVLESRKFLKISSYSSGGHQATSECESILFCRDIDGSPLLHYGIPALNGRGERLLIFMGIIDILQSYRFSKRLEHAWKSILHDGNTISVHEPKFYAKRFQTFLAEKVFKKVPMLGKGKSTGKLIKTPQKNNECNDKILINKDKYKKVEVIKSPKKNYFTKDNINKNISDKGQKFVSPAELHFNYLT